MTETYIRIGLALSLVWLACLPVSRSLRFYAVFVAAIQVIPRYPDSPLWWRAEWWPYSVLQIILGLLVCADLFNIQTRNRTLWYERVTVRLFGLCLGLAFAAFLWVWHPANKFQAWTVIHQYFRLVLFFGWLAVSVWFGWVRPLMPRPSDAVARFWTVWLGCQAVMGCTARAGLIWSILSATGHNYRVVNNTAMVLQFFSVLYLCLKGKFHARRKHQPRADSAAY